MDENTLFLEYLNSSPMRDLQKHFSQLIEHNLDKTNNKEIEQWLQIIDHLPDITPSVIDTDQSIIKIGCFDDCSQKDRIHIENSLRNFHPWRKGPFNLMGIFIDTEWRSDFKWDRLKNHISDLKNKTVLDVGCGNGYHCLRMWGAGARFVIGIDPYLRFVFQFKAISHFAPLAPVFVLPLKFEEFPDNAESFDTVFSMGVLHHRRSPLDHLFKLHSCLKPCGELVLECLVVDGDKNHILLPENRYAKMRNVWFIPSTSALDKWLKRCGFVERRLVDVNQTTQKEQRQTNWMTFESLKNFLDPNDQNITIEGLPAPKRAIFIARKRG